MGNKDHLPKFPACANEAPTGKELTQYDKKHFRLYLYLRLWLSEGATREELYEHMFYIDGKAEPDRARRMFDSHLERANWINTPECFAQLVSPPLRKHPSKKASAKSSGRATRRRVTAPKRRKKSAS
jgi:hypothetical protein